MEETKQQNPITNRFKSIFRAIQTTSILILFACVAILISGMINHFLTAGVTLTLFIFIIISLGVILSMPWIARVKLPNQRILSIVLLSLIGVSSLMWVISAIFIYLLYKNGETYTVNTIWGFINFIRISLIVSFQAIEANLISLCIIRFKKQYIAFQAIMYASYLFVDFWFSMLFSGFKFDTASMTPYFAPYLPSILSAGMITVLVIAIIYIVIANAIINSIEARKNGDYYDNRGRRRRRSVFHDALMESVTDIDDQELTKNNKETKTETKAEVSAEEKLAKLKELLDKKLITEEEYNKKREKIIEEM